MTRESLSFSGNADLARAIDGACDRFAGALHAGAEPRIEDFLAEAPAEVQDLLLQELLHLELEALRQRGRTLPQTEYLTRFPQAREIVGRVFRQVMTSPESLESTANPDAAATDLGLGGDAPPAPQQPSETPDRIGRYAIQRELGKGGFAVVYLAHDTELDRLVALKVPRSDRFTSEDDRERFVQEARSAAQLDHPGIVRVHDAQHDAGLAYIVQQYIPGQSLADCLKAQRLPLRRVAELMIAMAEAVGHAHWRGFVHRDLKPANILLDESGQPHVADFGLVLQLSLQQRHRGERAGTCAYMSPEQVRGEAHRLDGRSDIWSLGVMLYEMLAGCPPFRGDDRQLLIEEIEERDPRPLRQIDPAVPRELARICSTCLSKRAVDRYESASDLIDDLRHWLAADAAGPHPPELAQATSGEPLGSAPVPRVVPKGLRSFDAGDAEFFLELLPGPRDREGLPKSIRFWKTRIEQTDSEETFAVGLMYGPSGCGKSSLVKAGLLPRLAAEVLPVYVEATAADTEARLIKALTRHCPELPADGSLPQLFEQLRSSGGSRGRKLLLVLDQFEQWLHANQVTSDNPLVRALRQCDGGHLQCLLLVRDDFWMSVTRFLQALEIPLVEGLNSAAVDLFDADHARKVLVAFGRAYGRLADPPADPTPEQQRFLTQAVRGLVQEGKVVSVQVALFADMMKSRPWTEASLREVGGAAGVGVIFLDETFAAKTAPPNHRLHAKAIRAVLSGLLPETGTDIKGRMRSYQELWELSGSAGRSADFEAVLNILDHEVRLITPTEPDETGIDTPPVTERTARHYQLTHDYLVPSLRRWLRQKDGESSAGRARLRLADRAALYQSKPEVQQLPSWWEYFDILAWTNRRDWTPVQRRMMGSARHYYVTRIAALAALLVLLVWGGRESLARFKSQELVKGLEKAGEDKVLETVAELQPYLPWAGDGLHQFAAADAKTADERKRQFHARLALVATDEAQVKALVESLLTATPKYVGVIRDALIPYQNTVAATLWTEFHAEQAEADRRFRAGMALASYARDSEQWTDADYRFLVEQLVASNAEHQPVYRSYLAEIAAPCLPHLEAIFANATSSEEQTAAANAIADFAQDDQPRMARLLTIATAKQYEILFPLIAAAPDDAVKARLAEQAARLPLDDMSSVDRVPYGQQRAGAAITLLRLGERESVLRVFDMTDDPEAMTQFIHRCRDRGVRPEELLDLLKLVSTNAPSPPRVTPHSKQVTIGGEGRGEGVSGGGSTASPLTPALSPAGTPNSMAATQRGRGGSDRIRYALLLALGDYSLDEILASDREQLLSNLADWYAHDPSSGVHSAAGWLLRQWGKQEVVQQVDQTPVPYSTDREWFTLAVTVKSPRREHARDSSKEGSESTVNHRATQSRNDVPTESSDGVPEENTDASSAGLSSDAAPATDDKADTSTSDAETADDSEASATVAERTQRGTQSVLKTFYFTFIVFSPGEYRIGSASDEPNRKFDETQHTVRMTRPFALLDRELTFAELIAFDRQYAVFMEHSATSLADAASGPNWYDAAEFCRWLVNQAGFSEEQQAYANPESLDEQDYPHESIPSANWAPRNWPTRLDRKGFRLPTEEEWEAACRAGTRTAYGQGSDIGLLRHYAWYEQNNSSQNVHPPKTRRPGLRGLFDMHGNLYEWCHDWWTYYPTESVVNGNSPESGPRLSRVVRGGSWGYFATFCRSSSRYAFDPTNRYDYLGFRLALVLSSQADQPADEATESTSIGRGGSPTDREP